MYSANGMHYQTVLVFVTRETRREEQLISSTQASPCQREGREGWGRRRKRKSGGGREKGSGRGGRDSK